MTKVDTSIYILQIVVTMDESFEVTRTCFRDAKNISGYNKPTFFLSMTSEHPSIFHCSLMF